MAHHWAELGGGTRIELSTSSVLTASVTAMLGPNTPTAFASQVGYSKAF